MPVDGGLADVPTVLSGANLKEADLQGTDLKSARLNKSSLVHANLTQADLLGASMVDVHVRLVTWSNTTCPDGTNSNRDNNTCANHLG